MPVDALVVVPGGVSVERDASLSGVLVRELMEALRSGEADVALIPNVRGGSGLAEAIDRLPVVCRQQFSQSRVHRRLALPGSFDDFLASASKSLRYDIRRCEKGIAKDFGDRVTVATMSAPLDLERVLTDQELVAAKTYQRRLAVGFSMTGPYRDRVAFGLERGVYRAHIVYLDRAPIAFVDGFVHGGTFFFASTGYDPALASHRVGIYVQIQMLRESCADPAVGAVDYGSGEAEYKRRFADESWFETDVVLFPPSVGGLARNTVCSSFVAANRTAQALLTRFSLLDRLKSVWRRRLSDR
jgi:CelD/BcsL family acetyltransferase involved in cellulose biosynthesis